MWKVVVQNLLYFMHDLLPGAYSHSNWTKEGVDRAISWGLYCEKVTKKSSQNGNLQMAFHDMVKQYDWALSFQQLQTAQQHLFRFLLQNQLIDEEVRCYIDLKAREILGTDATVELCREVKQQLEFHDKLMIHLLRNEKFNRRFEIRLLLEAANSFSYEEMQKQFKHVVMSPPGLELLLEAALSQRDDNKNVGKASVVVLKWLESTLQSQDNSILYSSVITQLSVLPSSVLCRLLSENQSLHSVLLLTLKSEARKLHPCYDKGTYIWEPSEDDMYLLGYKELVNMCSALMADDSTNVETRKEIMRWSLEDGCMIWNDVIGDVNRKIMDSR